MKKIISMLLATLMLLSLCACADSGKADSTGLQVGWGRVNITPDYSVPMGGYSSRNSEAYLDYQYMTCIAVSDGSETILIYTMDQLNANGNSLADEYRVAITTATGIPMEKIFMSATHTHSAGDPRRDDIPASKKYKQDVLNAAAKAGTDALADLGPCKLYKAQDNLEKMNFIRHYKLEDGTYMGSNFNEDSISPIVDYATTPDTQMTLLKFDREDKTDILFVNWQAHPDHAYANGWNNLSADFVGAMRTVIEEDYGYLVGYYGGASGDVNPFSEIKEDNHGLSMTGYGEKLAELAVGIMEKFEPVEGTAVKAVTKVHTFTIDHTLDHMVPQAREIQSIKSKQGSTAAILAGREYGFSSVYHANAVISRATMAESEDRVLGAFCIGGVGFVEAKCEMFSDSAHYIKANSPFETTVIICGNATYIPTEVAYDYHSYEADTSLFVKGSAEKMNEELVSMLHSLK